MGDCKKGGGGLKDLPLKHTPSHPSPYGHTWVRGSGCTLREEHGTFRFVGML